MSRVNSIDIYNGLFNLLHYHPELLLGSRTRFPDKCGRDEAKHTLTSRPKTWILKAKRVPLSKNFAIF